MEETPMGVLIVLKQPVYKMGNRISSKLETLGPICLKELSVVDSIKMDATQK